MGSSSSKSKNRKHRQVEDEEETGSRAQWHNDEEYYCFNYNVFLFFVNFCALVGFCVPLLDDKDSGLKTQGHIHWYAAGQLQYYTAYRLGKWFPLGIFSARSLLYFFVILHSWYINRNNKQTDSNVIRGLTKNGFSYLQILDDALIGMGIFWVLGSLCGLDDPIGLISWGAMMGFSYALQVIGQSRAHLQGLSGLKEGRLEGGGIFFILSAAIGLGGWSLLLLDLYYGPGPRTNGLQASVYIVLAFHVMTIFYSFCVFVKPNEEDHARFKDEFNNIDRERVRGDNMEFLSKTMSTLQKDVFGHTILRFYIINRLLSLLPTIGMFIALLTDNDFFAL